MQTRMLTHTSGSGGNTNSLDASVMFQSPVGVVMLCVRDAVLERLGMDTGIPFQGGQDIRARRVHIADYPTYSGFILSDDRSTRQCNSAWQFFLNLLCQDSFVVRNVLTLQRGFRSSHRQCSPTIRDMFLNQGFPFCIAILHSALSNTIPKIIQWLLLPTALVDLGLDLCGWDG